MKKTLLLLSAVCAWSLYANASDKPAPLYWSAYEYCYNAAQGSATDNTYIPEEEFKKNIDWMADNLKDYGYNIICIDGWGDVNDYGKCFSGNGYRNRHDRNWEHDYKYWADYCKSKGMSLGIYQNPLWVEMGKGDAYVKGTNYRLRDIADDRESMWFKWVDVRKPGAKEYVYGYIKYYADMGVTYLRCDFMSWYEDGKDRESDFTRRRYLDEGEYQTALTWMHDACEEYGVTLSIVMPHCYNHAINERTYAPGALFRVNDDVCYATWDRFSDFHKGEHSDMWPQCYNMFDGMIFWSDISGKNKNNMILDGDFTRLNTFKNDDEKKSVISLQIIAGGPIAVADQYSSIGNNLKFYQNEELLALHNENFVGHPLSNSISSSNGCIWTGKAGECDYVLALFNRASGNKTYNIDFKETFGIENPVEVRDLWEHKDLGKKTSVSVSIPAHGCVVYRLKAN